MEVVSAAALTATESRWMTGGIAIAAIAAAAASLVILRTRRPSPTAVAYGCLAAVASVACGAIVGWLAAPYTPNGTLDDLAAAFGGGGGVLSVLLGAYLWGPIAAVAVVAWVACRRAAVHGRAGASGLIAAALVVAISALSLTVSGRPTATTILGSLGCATGAAAIAAELSERAKALAVLRHEPGRRSV